MFRGISIIGAAVSSNCCLFIDHNQYGAYFFLGILLYLMGTVP